MHVSVLTGFQLPLGIKNDVSVVINGKRKGNIADAYVYTYVVNGFHEPLGMENLCRSCHE